MSEFVPEGWKPCELGSLASKIEGGGTPSRNEPLFWGGNIPWATVKDLKGVRLSVTQEYISQLGLDKSASKLIPANTLIIASRMAVGKAVVFDKSVSINQDLKAFYPKPSIETEYLLHWYLSKAEIIENMGTGSTVKGIKLDDIKTLPIDLPPLPEQQKIAAILTSVDEVIEKTQAQINKLKDLKTGMMQELLTRGVGVDGKPHTEFKDSPVGRIPQGWDVVKLSEIIGSMDGGVSVNGENRLKTHKEIGVLKVSSVFKGAFIPHEHKVVIKEDLNRVKINPLKDRILFSRANTPSLVGESGYVERNYDDLYLPDKIWMIDVKDRLKVNVRWLSYILSSGKVRKLICDAATGTSSSMKNISKPNLLSIQVGMPMLEEQKAIADILNLISNKLTLSLTKLDHVKQLKKALMQDLLTGKVRVKVDS